MAEKWIATGFSLDNLELVEVDVAPPKPGEVTIDVFAIGMNPTDFKGVVSGTDRSTLPLVIGYEVAGIVSAVGQSTRIASGPVSVGDEVLAFRISGGYATEVTVPAKDVFAKPAGLDFPEAANLLLAGATAAEMLDVVKATAGETILVHGASGAVGVSVLQQAALLGVRVIGTASEANFGTVLRYSGNPVAYGDAARVQREVAELAPEGIAAALDCVGTDEAVDVSLVLVAERSRIVTIAAKDRAAAEGIIAIGGAMPASKVFRDEARARLIELAGEGKLVVPIARTFPFSEAPEALKFLSTGHPGGKLALLP